MQPVYVQNVADATIATASDDAHAGTTYELGGADIYTFREILEVMLRVPIRKRMIANIPLGLAKIMALAVEQIML